MNLEFQLFLIASGIVWQNARGGFVRSGRPIERPINQRKSKTPTEKNNRNCQGFQ